MIGGSNTGGQHEMLSAPGKIFFVCLSNVLLPGTDAESSSGVNKCLDTGYIQCGRKCTYLQRTT